MRWGTESELGRRSLRGVCLQLVLITGLMWCSDLQHTLTLQSQVKAGYGFVEAPFTAASVSQLPSSERRETEGLFYRKDSL